MSRGTLYLMLTCVLLPLVALQFRMHLDGAASGTSSPTAPAEQVTPVSAISDSEPRPQQVVAHRPVSPEESELRSSWEAPFQSRLWTYSGWQFSSDRMRAVAPTAWATFRRQYPRLMLDLQLNVPAQTQPEFEIRLSRTDVREELRIALVQDELLLTEVRERSTRKLKQRACEPSSAAPGPHPLRVILTGQRMMIHWHGRVWLTAEQPSAATGEPLQWTLVSHTPNLSITSLRVEGE